jgi:ArsR family metal-binding transcriptional regulator
VESSTFFFGNAEDLDRAVALTRGDGLDTGVLTPSPVDPSIRVWAATVRREASTRAKDLFISADLPPIGFYDLPQPERPLPTEPPAEIIASPLGKMWPAFVAQCYADTRKTRIITHHENDVAALMPYLNSVMKSAQYNPGAPTLSFKRGVRAITLYPNKIAIAKADDMLDAWLLLKELKDLCADLSCRLDEITPDHSRSDPPMPLDIYKLLPRANCEQCGSPTCLAFAALLAAAEAHPDACPFLKDAEYAEGRFRLFELLGETP